MSAKARRIIEQTKEFKTPLTVPKNMHDEYRKNYLAATKASGRLFLFAGDQKIEHMNEDFYGEGIAEESASPRHLFEIASKARVGAFATQLGLIARYGALYQNVSYVVKLNSKTNLVSIKEKDPVSLVLHTVDQVAAFKENSELDVVGVGYTVYLGSEFESQMLQEAAQVIYQAHQYGMIAVIWMYPRGKAVEDERSAHVIAGAAGVAACLGADFVKINTPQADSPHERAELLLQATQAAGKTKVICSGGSLTDEESFLQELYLQVHSGGVLGAAIGRNIHQKPLEQAIAFSEAVATIVLDNKSLEKAQEKLHS